VAGGGSLFGGGAARFASLFLFAHLNLTLNQLNLSIIDIASRLVSSDPLPIVVRFSGHH
jgi:hypothetical protein